ncbi:unnamed protein product [Bursaphelenchus okinawaensis]|uniref:Neurotrypsin n=1 Tax=Bursaphelenchus okinawaensis TaxID=465554 RepID=A0A811KWP4_9BILA|nr:unnamed protein product [Bursaphelenchus okinawaensis]CAG9112432.1 unnamed protein product [Bursaphelenchus okinawaensis]
MFCTVLPCLVLLVCLAFGEVFRVDNGLVNVFDKDVNQFLQICGDNLDVTALNYICKQIQGRRLSSYKKVPNIALLSSNLTCSNDTCTTDRILSCSSGVEVKCNLADYSVSCPAGFLKVGRSKCLGVVTDINYDYDGAAVGCGKYHNSTLASLSDIDTKTLYLTLKQLNTTLKAVRPFITSAVRIRKDWKWTDGCLVEKSPEGMGRCLALQLSQGTVVQKAMDCTLPQFIALCQIDLATECSLPGEYHGTISTTVSGSECMKWNDVRITKNGLFSSSQKLWDHNYCKIVSGNGVRPWCMISDQVYEECKVGVCNVPLLTDNAFATTVATVTKCNEGELQCGQSAECVASEFICDYDLDCFNGFDEQNCPDFLSTFELVGEFRLVDDVSEVWTNIRHVQGCAQRCIQNPDCESFSYDVEREFCFLSRIYSNPAVLFERSDSFYYQRKFTTGLFSSSRNITNMIVEVTKGTTSGAICVDNITETDQLCRQFGFGPSLMFPLRLTTRPSNIWSVDCLRKDKQCSSEAVVSCRRFLRCSNCSYTQFPCQLEPKCVEQHQVCDGRVDCGDASDEIGCQNVRWRLNGDVDEVIPEGRVQLSFQDSWTDVCSDGLTEDDVNSLCNKLGKGAYGRVLPIYDQTPTATTWMVKCINGDCKPLKVRSCGNGILNLRCETDESLSCGRRFFKARTKRVVGGFDATMGAYPWTAALRFNYGDLHHCGAVIIADRFVLSAAHCFETNKDPKDFTVVTGDWNNRIKEGTEQVLQVEKINFFPNYEDLFQHDIVILKTKSRIKFDQFSQPICLPPRGYRYVAGQVCVATGWGSNGTAYSDKMKAAAMPILDREECRNASKIYSAVSKTSFCAGYLSGGIDSCQGDSGGPFACQYDGVFYLGGIISWGEGCAQQKHPGIYTMITPYLSWIENVTSVAF